MKILYAHEVEPMLFHSEDVMFFDTLSDAILHAKEDDQIIHYGKKGMRWGVVNLGANIGLKTAKINNSRNKNNLVTSTITSKDALVPKTKMYAKESEFQRKATGSGGKAFAMRYLNSRLSERNPRITKRQVANRSIYNEEMAKYFSDKYKNKQIRKGRM